MTPDGRGRRVAYEFMQAWSGALDVMTPAQRAAMREDIHKRVTLELRRQREADLIYRGRKRHEA